MPAKWEEAFKPFIPPVSQENQPIPTTIEYEKATEHVKNSVFRPRTKYEDIDRHNNNDCEVHRLHLRNCPECQAYIRELFLEITPKTEAIEKFINSDKVQDNIVDLLILIGLGFLILFILDKLK